MRYSTVRTYSRTEEAFSTSGRAGGSFGPSGKSTLPDGRGVAVGVAVLGVAVDVSVWGMGVDDPVWGPMQPAVMRAKVRKAKDLVDYRYRDLGLMYSRFTSCSK